MRELVYLSEAKLSQFLPTKTPWWTRLGRGAKIELTVPLFKLAVGAGEQSGDSTASHLESVVAHVQNSAKWYGDPTLRPGEWIQFDLPMHATVWPSAEESRIRPPVFFHSASAKPRLLLHGSARHFFGLTDRATELDRDVVADWHSTSAFTVLVRWLQRKDALNPLVGVHDGKPSAPDSIIDLLIRALERQAIRGTAVWLGGYARATVVESSFVAATPLYVEHIPPPTD